MTKLFSVKLNLSVIIVSPWSGDNLMQFIWITFTRGCLCPIGLLESTHYRKHRTLYNTSLLFLFVSNFVFRDYYWSFTFSFGVSLWRCLRPGQCCNNIVAAFFRTIISCSLEWKVLTKCCKALNRCVPFYHVCHLWKYCVIVCFLTRHYHYHAFLN